MLFQKRASYPTCIDNIAVNRHADGFLDGCMESFASETSKQASKQAKYTQTTIHLENFRDCWLEMLLRNIKSSRCKILVLYNIH